jgi:membrane protein DedA with SNARE-associated domain
MGPGMFDDLFKGLAMLFVLAAFTVGGCSYYCGKTWGNKRISVQVMEPSP